MLPAHQHLLVLGTINQPILASAIFDEKENTVTLVDKISSPYSPDWVTRHPTHKDLIYTACRENWNGQICLVRVSPEGKLTILDEANSGLSDPAAMEILPDATGIVSAHFIGGGVTLVPLAEDGTFVRKQPDHSWLAPYTPQPHKRQGSSHCHHVVNYKDDIIIPDQGSNEVWILKYDSTKGFTLAGTIGNFEPEDGPRHVAMHPSGKYIYVLNEISSILSVHTYPTASEPSKLLSRHAMHPPSDAKNALGAPMMSSEVIFFDNQVMCTNRDTPNVEGDAIAIFNANDDGSVSTPMFLWPGMKHMRSMSTSPDGRFIVVAGTLGGGLTMYDKRWNTKGKLDFGDIAIQIWME